MKMKIILNNLIKQGIQRFDKKTHSNEKSGKIAMKKKKLLNS